jgi:hypothetical protein
MVHPNRPDVVVEIPHEGRLEASYGVANHPRCQERTADLDDVRAFELHDVAESARGQEKVKAGARRHGGAADVIDPGAVPSLYGIVARRNHDHVLDVRVIGQPTRFGL